MFWYIFEALKDGNLGDRLTSEVLSCVSSGALKIKDHLPSLLRQPLLQSAYAETLRMRVAIALPRTCERGHFDIAGRRVEKNQHIAIFTSPLVPDDAGWIGAGKPPLKPLTEFWADRFLAPKQLAPGSKENNADDPPELEFSLRGLAGRWIPYGGGQHLCPGRHYAKNQLIGTFAFLFANYDMELLDGVKSNKVKPDMRWFPSGSLPPDRQVPFRIRRKIGSAS